MNNSELNRLLKSAPVPERPADYWQDFPRQVLAALPRGTGRSTASQVPSWRRLALARFWLTASMVTVCLVIGFALSSWRQRSPGLTARDLATARTYLREMEALFPNQVRTVVFEQAGPRLLLAERADVPAAQPVFVRVCGPDGCRSFLTFSGQQIQLNGDWLDVLVDARGHVLLVGAKLAWTSGDANARAGDYRFAARSLGTAT